MYIADTIFQFGIRVLAHKVITFQVLVTIKQPEYGLWTGFPQFGYLQVSLHEFMIRITILQLCLLIPSISCKESLCLISTNELTLKTIEVSENCPNL